MKAMVLRRPADVSSNPLESADLAAPAPGPEDILVKVKYCGVCHTDLHAVEGELPKVKLPLVPGHQIVGVVAGRGAAASRFKEGDRVGAAWLYSTCGHCEFCLSGRENLCRDARFTGYQVDGGYAEYFVIPEKFAYALPSGFGDEEAAPLLCAGIVGFRALRLSEVKNGQRLGIFGFGASAHIVMQVARHWGCEIFVFTRSPEHRRLAESLGAAWTGTAQDEPPAKLHGAVIFAPAGGLVLDALLKLERGGTLALAGITMSPIPELDYDRHLYHERTMRSVANATRRDGEEFFSLAAEIPIRTTTRVFDLKDANRVLNLLKQGRISGAAVLRVSS
jgi:propanol-preferring alcohol dehydrogenase